jgi:hypothetical protein
MLSAETSAAFVDVLKTEPKPKTLSLADYTDEMLALDSLAAMDDGEWSDEHQALADELGEKLAKKADDFWRYRLTLKADAERAKEYAKAVREKADRLAKRVEWMDGYAMREMERSGRPFLKGDIWEVRKQQNPAAVVVDCLPAALPLEFQRVVPEVIEVDRKALGEALKAGAEIEGARLEYSFHLRAK